MRVGLIVGVMVPELVELAVEDRDTDGEAVPVVELVAEEDGV